MAIVDVVLCACVVGLVFLRIISASDEKCPKRDVDSDVKLAR